MQDLEKQRIIAKINLSQLRKHFSKKGYEFKNLEQAWRHVTGVLVKNSKEYFFKMASSPQVAEWTKNEYEWNNLINSYSNSKNFSADIPKNHDKGKYKGLFWFMCDYAGDKLLAVPTEKMKTKSLESNLVLVAKSAKNIIDIKTSKKLPREKDVPVKERKDKFFEKLKYYTEMSGRNNDDLIYFIKERIDCMQTAPHHGDFVPWHFIINKNTGRLCLIDGEHANIDGIKFYDVIYFYHRVYTKLKRPDIADKFIKQFISIFPMSSKDKKLIELLVAWKLISGYFDARTDNITSTKLQSQLKEKLLKGNVLI